jgi:hypothetical protein
MSAKGQKIQADCMIAFLLDFANGRGSMLEPFLLK